jgi:hypothetical protein
MMPGEFTSGTTPETDVSKDINSPPAMDPGKIATDVDDVFADGLNGRDGLPVFDVEKDDFYQNMSHGRKRLRFKSGSSVQTYMQKSKYNKPFYIKHGEYIRKVK